MSKILTRLDAYESEDEFNVLDAINLINSAWNKISQDIIKNCFIISGFKNLKVEFPLIRNDNELANEAIMRTYCELKNIDKITFNAYVEIDDNEQTSSCLSDKEIVQMCREQTEPEDVHEQVCDTIERRQPIDLKTSIFYLDSIKHMLNSLNLSEPGYSQAIQSIETIDEIIVSRRLATQLKQTKIDAYFL